MELRLQMPRLTVRRLGTGAQPPAPGSRPGSTGTPKHSFRCPDVLWGQAVNTAAGRGHELGPVLRGYVAAYVAGVAPVFPDPMGGPAGDDVEA